jgi:hypothetical protein
MDSQTFWLAWIIGVAISIYVSILIIRVGSRSKEIVDLLTYQNRNLKEISENMKRMVNASGGNAYELDEDDNNETSSEVETKKTTEEKLPWWKEPLEKK